MAKDSLKICLKDLLKAAILMDTRLQRVSFQRAGEGVRASSKPQTGGVGLHLLPSPAVLCIVKEGRRGGEMGIWQPAEDRASPAGFGGTER